MSDSNTDIAELREQVRQSLNQLRQDIIAALTELDVEMDTLRNAIVEAPVTAQRLEELRDRSQKIAHRFRERHAQTISLFPAH